MLTQLRYNFPALASVGIRLVGVTIGFLIVIIIGRSWGAAGNGMYGLISQTAMFLAVVAVGGIDLAAVRALAGIDPQRQRLACGTILRLLGITFFFATIPALVLLLFGDNAIGWISDDPFPPQAIAAVVTLLVARALSRILSAILRAQQFFLLGQAMEAVLIPLPFALALLIFVDPSLDNLVRWVAITATASVVIGLGVLLLVYCISRASGRTAHSPPLRGMAATALPLWGVTITLSFAEWYGLTVVTSEVGLDAAGIFRVVMQYVLIFSVVSAGLTGVYNVRIAAAQSVNDWVEVARHVRSFTLLSAALALIPAAALITFARPLLAIVGPEFVAGATALQIGSIGQAAYLVLAPAGLTLAMTGHARASLFITFLSTAILVSLAPIAASYFGLNGVVACISALLVARNLAATLLLRHLLGINALTGRYCRSA